MNFTGRKKVYRAMEMDMLIRLISTRLLYLCFFCCCMLLYAQNQAFALCYQPPVKQVHPSVGLYQLNSGKLYNQKAKTKTFAKSFFKLLLAKCFSLSGSEAYIPETGLDDEVKKVELVIQTVQYLLANASTRFISIDNRPHFTYLPSYLDTITPPPKV